MNEPIASQRSQLSAGAVKAHNKVDELHAAANRLDAVVTQAEGLLNLIVNGSSPKADTRVPPAPPMSFDSLGTALAQLPQGIHDRCERLTDTLHCIRKELGI